MRKLSVLVIGLLSAAQIWAQGCSDAGFCSAGGLKSQGADGKSGLTFHLIAAGGEQGTGIYTFQPEWNWKIDSLHQLQVKWPIHYISGDLGNVNGLGDPIISCSRLLYEPKEWKWTGSLGARIPVNRADKSLNNRPLPMPYQTSLGTYDLIAGLSLKNDQWLFALGFQQPLIQNNENGFLLDSAVGAKELGYFNSAGLMRSGDIMLRAERTHEWKNWQFTGGFLPIVHLTRDTYRSSSKTIKSIEGSEGLTFNVNLNAKYNMKKGAAGIMLAMPLIVRENRPDGLTRAFVVGPYYTIAF